MATILKNIVRFTGLAVDTPVALPHLLNVNGIPVTPKTVQPNLGGYTITANATNVTVTRTTGAAADVDVLVEYWHSIESVVPLVPPPGKLIGKVPWIQQPPAGGGGGGGPTPSTVFQYYTDFIRADGKFTEDLGNPSTGWANTGPGSLRIARISTNGANEGALWEVGDTTNFGNFLWVNNPVQPNGAKLSFEWGGNIADLSPTVNADFTSRFVAGTLMSSSVVGGNGDGFGFSLGLAQNGNANLWGFLNDATKVDLGILNDFNSHVYRVEYTIGTGVQWFIDGALLGTIAGVPSADGLAINCGFNMRTPAANAGAPGMELDYLLINYDYIRY